jgi:enolase
VSPPEVTGLVAREVIDCRGLPTVQVDLGLADGTVATADVPSGRSTGSAEATELRDGGERFGGFGVLSAVANVNGEIRDALTGSPLPEQRELDAGLIELDGTEQKSRLGANAILGVSLAAARARAATGGLPLYRSLSANAHLLRVPLVNRIDGGKDD